MAPGIYDAKGRWIEFGENVDHASLTTEIATTAAVGEMDVGGMLAGMPDPDPVLRKRGDDARVLEDLTADDQVITAMQNRKLRVLNRPDYDFKPGLLPGKEATAQAENLCEALTTDLEAINLRNVFSEILDTPFYGYSVLEIMWEATAGKYRLADLVAKPREWFTFDRERRPALKPTTGEPKPLPAGKFIVIRHFPTYKNPYGLRLLSRCLWPVAFKRGGIRFYTRFLERYGMPWPIGKAPKSASQKDKENMAADLASMVRDAVAVIPHGAEVELMQSKGTAGAQFEKYLQRWDKAIFKVIMGQTLTSEMDGQGSRAAAQVHMGVAEDMSEADQFIVASAMNELAIIYRNINAPGVEAPVFGYHEPEDYNAQAELDNKLYTVGVRFAPGHFERRYGLQPDEFTLAGDGEPEPEAGKQGGTHAENRPGGHESAINTGLADGPDLANNDGPTGTGPGQGLLDQFVEAVLPAAAKQNGKFIERLLDLLERAESYEDIQLLLAEHLGRDLDMEAQEELLADLMAAAELMGRAAVVDEADAD